jgi:hypothetical protein
VLAKTINFIWLQPPQETTFANLKDGTWDDLPASRVFKANIRAWGDMNHEQGWKTRLWDRQAVIALLSEQGSPVPVDLYTELPTIIQADIARVAILYKFGGVYVDVDAVPILPLAALLGESPCSNHFQALVVTEEAGEADGTLINNFLLASRANSNVFGDFLVRGLADVQASLPGIRKIQGLVQREELELVTKSFGVIAWGSHVKRMNSASSGLVCVVGRQPEHPLSDYLADLHSGLLSWKQVTTEHVAWAHFHRRLAEAKIRQGAPVDACEACEICLENLDKDRISLGRVSENARNEHGLCTSNLKVAVLNFTEGVADRLRTDATQSREDFRRVVLAWQPEIQQAVVLLTQLMTRLPSESEIALPYLFPLLNAIEDTRAAESLAKNALVVAPDHKPLTSFLASVSATRKPPKKKKQKRKVRLEI